MKKTMLILLALACVTGQSFAQSVDKIADSGKGTIYSLPKPKPLSKDDLKKVPEPKSEYKPLYPVYGLSSTGVELGVFDVVSENGMAVGILKQCKGAKFADGAESLSNQLDAFIEKSAELESARKYLKAHAKAMEAKATPTDASASKCAKLYKTAMEP